MPEIDSLSPSLTNSLRVGDSIKNAAPSHEASPRIGEITPIAQKNAVSEIIIEPAEEAVTQEVTEDTDFVSGAVKARKLGESRRKLAQSILDSAETSLGARDNFKKLIQEDKELDKYFKKHFPTQYQSATSEISQNSLSSEEQNIEQQTKAKILAEDIQAGKEEEAFDLAVKLKFNQQEADELVIMASKLEGTKVNGKELDFETALKRAARIIHPDKAKAGITVLPSSRGLDDTKILQTQAKNEQLVDKFRGVAGYVPNRDQMLKNLQVVDQGYDTKNRRFVMPESQL